MREPVGTYAISGIYCVLWGLMFYLLGRYFAKKYEDRLSTTSLDQDKPGWLGRMKLHNAIGVLGFITVGVVLIIIDLIRLLK